jgi:hypothetical protein
MRHVLALLALSGCAAMFQDHEPSYRLDHEPRCSTSAGWRVVDAGGAVLGGLTAIKYAQDDPVNYTVVGVATLLAVVHAISAVSGVGWAGECEDARRDYDRQRGEPRMSRAVLPEGVHGWCYGAPSGPRCFRSEEACAKATWEADAVTSACAEQGAGPPPPSGSFFCATSPTVAAASLCAHGEAACEQARGVAIAAVPDLGPCAAATAVYCFRPDVGGEVARCAATAESCAAQHDAVAASSTDTTLLGTCVEAR